MNIIEHFVNGKNFSGDSNRKSKVFKWFTHNAPKNVDYLLMEGTQLGRKSKIEKSRPIPVPSLSIEFK